MKSGEVIKFTSPTFTHLALIFVLQKGKTASTNLLLLLLDTCNNFHCLVSSLQNTKHNWF